MIKFEQPYISSIEEKLNFEKYDMNPVYPFSNMSKPLLEISEGMPDNTVSLEDNKQFIVTRLVNIIKTYDQNGNETITRNYYPVNRCTEGFFEKT